MNNGFRSFPEKLYNKAVRVTNIAAKMFGMSRPAEIFYSVKDGSHNDLSIWQTVSGREGKLPTSIDDVYVKTIINVPTNTALSCNNLHVSDGAGVYFNLATYVAEAGIAVNGSVLNCEGTMNCPLHTNSVKTYFNKKNNPVSSMLLVRYTLGGDQPIFDMDYGMLGISGTANGQKKFLTGNTTCTSFSNGGANLSYFEIGPYDFTCTGAFNSFGLVSVTGNGNILLIGTANFSGGTQISGAPTVELRGGISAWVMMHPTVGILLPIIDANKRSGTGFGLWKFTTNNQNILISVSQIILCHCEMQIAAGITVTNIFTNVSSALQMESTGFINCVDAAGTFINNGILYFNNPSNFDITTGTLVRTGVSNIIGYIFNGSATLPYTTYQGLYIAGTGTKTALGNTTLGTTLVIAAGATFALNTFDLTVGTTASGVNTTSLLTKTGAGSILFTGSLNNLNLNLSGNPTVECRGGLNYSSFGINWTNTGTGAWNFTTNNQTIQSLNTAPLVFNNPVLIVGAITLTIGEGLSQLAIVYGLQFNTSINGTVAGSTLINKGNIHVGGASVTVMTIGVLDIATFDNFVIYSYVGAGTIPYTTYRRLSVLNSVNTVKTLSGNTTANELSVHGPVIGSRSILDLSTFDLTVTNTTSVNHANIVKSSAGNILFMGAITATGSIAQLEFTGNPAVEFRGGIVSTTGLNITGSPTLNFTTNNQTISVSLVTYGTSSFNILGAITITHTALGTLLGILNGNNAASKFDNRIATTNGFQYQNAAQPMITGLLETDAAANVFKYNGTVAQAVKSGTYRTIEFGGSGSKQLQGNVVSTARSTTGTATIDLNGFTITP